MNRKILAFYSPYPGAGKSTAAEYLSRTGGHFHYVRSFADPLYYLADYTLGCLGLHETNVRRDKEEHQVVIGGACIRDMLIAFGQAGREVYSDMWVACMRHTLSCCVCTGATIDDLRFPNEYDMLRQEGAKIVRITNPGREIKPSGTEALLEGYSFDAELENDKGNIMEYHALLDALVEYLWPR